MFVRDEERTTQLRRRSGFSQKGGYSQTLSWASYQGEEEVVILYMYAKQIPQYHSTIPSVSTHPSPSCCHSPPACFYGPLRRKDCCYSVFPPSPSHNCLCRFLRLARFDLDPLWSSQSAAKARFLLKGMASGASPCPATAMGSGLDDGTLAIMTPPLTPPLTPGVPFVLRPAFANPWGCDGDAEDLGTVETVSTAGEGGRL